MQCNPKKKRKKKTTTIESLSSSKAKEKHRKKKCKERNLPFFFHFYVWDEVILLPSPLHIPLMLSSPPSSSFLSCVSSKF
jgi:hypothetical protein